MKNKEPIVFKCEASLWQMLKDRRKTWDARLHDMGDDRIYRLSWGRFADPSLIINQAPKYVPEEPTVRFLNKETGAVLEFWFRGLRFADFAPGWCFIILGNRKWK